MRTINNFGIIAAISWHSNHWADDPEDEDLDKSKFKYVQDNDHMHESLNFGHEKYPAEEDGGYIAYTPMFNRLPGIESSKYVTVVFFKSFDYHVKKNFIVGFYAFPEIDEFERKADHPMYNEYDWGNVKSDPKNIVYLNNKIEIDNDIASIKGYLPKQTKLGQQGFNYLHSDNVMKILDQATKLNPDDWKLKAVKSSILKVLL